MYNRTPHRETAQQLCLENERQGGRENVALQADMPNFTGHVSVQSTVEVYHTRRTKSHMCVFMIHREGWMFHARHCTVHADTKSVVHPLQPHVRLWSFLQCLCLLAKLLTALCYTVGNPWSLLTVATSSDSPIPDSKAGVNAWWVPGLGRLAAWSHCPLV